MPLLLFVIYLVRQHNARLAHSGPILHKLGAVLFEIHKVPLLQLQKLRIMIELLFITCQYFIVSNHNANQKSSRNTPTLFLSAKNIVEKLAKYSWVIEL